MLKSPVLAGVLAALSVVAASVQVTELGSRGLRLRYEPGEPEFSTDGALSAVRFQDAEFLAEPGEYDLPVKVVRVGIPQTGGVRVRTTLGPARMRDGVEIQRAQAVGLEPGARAPVPQSPGYAPAEVVVVSPVRRFRDNRYVEVRIAPCRYLASARRLETYDWVEVDLEFEQPGLDNPAPDPLDRVFASTVVNAAQSLGWKDPAGEPNRVAGRLNFYERHPYWVRLDLSETGIYSVSGSELAQLGVQLGSIEPGSLSLYTVGEHEFNGPYPDTMMSVAALVRGAEDGRFDPQDRIIFYALGPDHWVGACSSFTHNPYCRFNAYWLAWGGGPGTRMRQGLGPDTAGARVARFGRDVLHQEREEECPARSGLLWVWRTITKDAYSEVAEFEPELALQFPSTIRRIRCRVYAWTDANELTMLLNGRVVGTARFDAIPANAPLDLEYDVNMPAEFGSNRLRFELRGNGQKQVFIDYVEVEYDRRLSLYSGPLHFIAADTGRTRFVISEVPDEPVVLDVTDHHAPKLCEGVEYDGASASFSRLVFRTGEFAVATEGQFLRPVKMSRRTPGRTGLASNQADYWVVTPGEFLAPAQRLARYRRGNVAGFAGIRTGVAVLEDLYDDYALGMQEPGAVRAFLADKRPVCGLLAGDATYDYRNNLGRQQTPGVPAYEIGVGLDPSGTQQRSTLALDIWYADFDDVGFSPDMMLGRVTCRSAQEFSRFVDKLIAYETGPAGLWTRRFVLLADDEWLGQGAVDPIGITHTRQAEGVSVMPGRRLEPVKVYLTEYPFAEVKSKPQARAELLRQLNRGALLFVFFGHGDAFDLCHESAFNVSLVGQVNNGANGPFCFFGSCSVGRFEDTRYECISEELVRKPDGGAVAVVGASRATASGTNEVFCRTMLAPFFRDSMPDSIVGAAFLAAWPTERLYHLFGDPATKLRLGAESREEIVVSPETLQPGGRFSGRGLLGVSGRAEWCLAAPWRHRRYYSTRGVLDYVLPGAELARGNFTVRDGRFACSGMLPVGLGFDTVFVSDGYYATVEKSMRLSASVYSGAAHSSVLGDTLDCSAVPAAGSDRSGPEIGFFSDGRWLADGSEVPADCEFEGVLSDPSGILIMPSPEYGPRFFVNNHEFETDLTDRLVFDESLSTTARFRMNVKLAGAEDTLRVFASDNQGNRTLAQVVVKPLRTGEKVRVESLLVFPNPVSGKAWFCFSLSRGGTVRVRVYTMQGRLVADLGEQAAGFGYNQIEWDGRDRQGAALANGVYLYTLTASTMGAAGPESAVVRDRLVVVR